MAIILHRVWGISNDATSYPLAAGCHNAPQKIGFNNRCAIEVDADRAMTPPNTHMYCHHRWHVYIIIKLCLIVVSCQSCHHKCHDRHSKYSFKPWHTIIYGQIASSIPLVTLGETPFTNPPQILYPVITTSFAIQPCQSAQYHLLIVGDDNVVMWGGDDKTTTMTQMDIQECLAVPLLIARW